MKLIRNETLNMLAKKHQYEIRVFPMHWTDEMCVNDIRGSADHNLVTYVALMRGVIPILTIAGHKAFVADFSQYLQSPQNPSCNSITKEEKHLRDQRGSA